MAALANGAELSAEDELDLVFCPHTPGEALIEVAGEVRVLVVLTTKRLLALGHTVHGDGVLPWCIDATHKVARGVGVFWRRRFVRRTADVYLPFRSPDRPTRFTTPC